MRSLAGRGNDIPPVTPVTGRHGSRGRQLPTRRRRVAPLDSERDGLPGRSRALVCRDVALVAQRERDVVEAFEQTPAGVVVHLEGGGEIARRDRPRLEVDGDRGARLVLEELPQQLDVVLVALRGEQAGLAAVAAEDG